MREGAGEPLSELLGICFMMFKATRPRDAASGGASSTGPCKNLIPLKTVCYSRTYRHPLLKHSVNEPAGRTAKAGRTSASGRCAGTRSQRIPAASPTASRISTRK